MNEVDVLSGLQVCVSGHDPASVHARHLLRVLGASPAPDIATANAIIDTSGITAHYAVPHALADATSAPIAWARSGAMSLTADGVGRPLLAGAGAASAVRAAMLVTAVLNEVRTGHRVGLADVTLLGERAATAELTRRPGWSVGGNGRSLQACDGWWFLSLARESDVSLLPALIERDASGDPWSAVAAWSASRRASEAVARAQLLGLAAAVVEVPGNPISNAEQPRHRPSPLVRARRGGARRAAADPPVILDLSSLWAGPLCAQILGACNATVIKVESTRRLDGARRGPTAFYDLLHYGHASLTLDFTSARGRAQLQELVTASDVVIESSRPRALQQLGIDAIDAVAAGTIWTSITGYGRTGPWAHRVGLGDDVAMSAGFSAIVDGRPVPIGDAIADPLAGVHAAAATVAALLSDTGVLLDISMRAVARSAAALPVEPAKVVGSCGAGWEVVTADDRAPVARPTARRPPGSAAAPGADNDALLHRADPS